MRIVLDTNIFVAGLLSKDHPPGRLIAAWLEEAFVLITSRPQIDELRRVMDYEKIRSLITPQQAASLLDNLDTSSLIVEPRAGVDLSPDPDDNTILATALAGAADLLVTGDKRDLLSLGAIDGLEIVTARKAAGRLGA